MDCSTPGLPVPHLLPEFAQVHLLGIGDAIWPSHPLLPTPALSLSQHQGLFQTNSRLFAPGDQSIGASASASVLSMSIQG